jgi:hypothetical protein
VSSFWQLYLQGKRPWYPLDRWLGGHQSRSGSGGEKNSEPLPGLEPSIFQAVAQRYATELSRLTYCFKNKHVNIIIPSTPRSSQWCLPFRFSDQNFVYIFHTSHACSDYLVFLDLITLIIIWGGTNYEGSCSALA